MEYGVYIAEKTASLPQAFRQITAAATLVGVLTAAPMALPRYGHGQIGTAFESSTFESPSDQFVAESKVISAGTANIRALLTWTDGWNGYDALAPKPDAVEHATNWFIGLYNAVLDMGVHWIAPNVTGGSDGEVVLEWWSGEKTLTVYISPDDSEYVRTWGSDINSEMDDGDAEPINARRELWKWLVS